jgi:hypothetical protein
MGVFQRVYLQSKVNIDFKKTTMENEEEEN